jgi:CBS domain containing-hemolysin-like protein
MRWSLALFRPFLAILNGAALGLLRLVGVSEQAHRHLHSPEEIDLLIAESRDGGLLEPEEQQRLRRALHLNMRTARDLMVARDRVTMVELGTPWDTLVRTVVTSPFSRLPVYEGTPDRIVGILRVKDLVERFVSEGAAPLESLMRPVIEIPEELAADRVVTELREKRVHAAIVVDASRTPVGLITIQDLLEELLGQRPSPADRPMRRQTGGGEA